MIVGEYVIFNSKWDDYSSNAAENKGGVIHITAYVTGEIKSCTIQDNQAEMGRFMSVESDESAITLDSNDIKGVLAFNYRDAFAMLNNYTYGNGSAIYISGETNITSISNTYQNFYGSLIGGVYLIVTGQLIDIDSTYKNNTSLQGGAIACQSSCWAYLKASSLNKNMASQGGAIYLDSSSNLTLSYTYFTSNSAVEEGGVIYIITNAFMTASGCSFIKNSASLASTIYASETSGQYALNISNSLFTQNRANSNTVSLQNADANIYETIFSDNTATKYSENIFIGFSTLYVEGSTFTDNT